MAILGVLLGITMCAVAWAIKETIDNAGMIIRRNIEMSHLADRVAFLEKRKALLAEAVATQPKPVGVGAVKMRTWNEDAESAFEKAAR